MREDKSRANYKIFCTNSKIKIALPSKSYASRVEAEKVASDAMHWVIKRYLKIDDSDDFKLTRKLAEKYWKNNFEIVEG